MSNWPFQVISDHFSGKRLGKVAKHAKLAAPSDFGPLQWEKIGKVAKCTKLAIQSDFGLLW